MFLCQNPVEKHAISLKAVDKPALAGGESVLYSESTEAISYENG
jgi:hypothetical protein